MTPHGCNHTFETIFDGIFRARPQYKRMCIYCSLIEFSFCDGTDCNHLWEEMSLEIGVKPGNPHEKPINETPRFRKLLNEPREAHPMRRCVHCRAIVISPTVSYKELKRREEKVANYHKTKPGPKPKEEKAA